MDEKKRKPTGEFALVAGTEGVKVVENLLRQNRVLHQENQLLLHENDTLRGIIDSMEHKIDVLEQELAEATNVDG